MAYHVAAIALLILGIRTRYDRAERTILYTGAACASWIGWGKYTVEQVVPFVFPVLAAMSLIVCVATLYRYFFLIKSRDGIINGLYLFSNFLSMAFLGLLTGDNEAVRLEMFRTGLGLIWFLTIVLLAVSLKNQIDAFLAIRGLSDE